MGDAWEWPPGRQRLLLNVSEVSLYHMRRETVLSRFGAQQLACMPVLRLLRLVGNDFHSLASVSTCSLENCQCSDLIDGLQVDAVCELFGPSLEHLILRDNPVNTAAGSSLLRNYIIAAMSGLLSFNEVPVSADERRSAELLYRPLMALHRGGPTIFSSRPPRTEEKVASGTSSRLAGRRSADTSVSLQTELTQNALRQHRLGVEFEIAFEETVKSIILETFETLASQRR